MCDVTPTRARTPTHALSVPTELISRIILYLAILKPVNISKCQSGFYIAVFKQWTWDGRVMLWTGLINQLVQEIILLQFMSKLNDAKKKEHFNSWACHYEINQWHLSSWQELTNYLTQEDLEENQEVTIYKVTALEMSYIVSSRGASQLGGIF